MIMKVPDTKLLETFLIIAQERNLISAASTLEVSQPTLTQRLQKLEKFLGSSLFYRNVRPLKLTKLGQKMLLEVPKILNHNQKFWTSIKTFNQTPHSLLRLGMPDSLSEIMGAECLNALSKMAKRIELKSGISPGLENSFRAFEFDFAIDTDPFEKHSNCEMISLFNDPFIIVTPNSWKDKNLNSLVNQNPLVGYGRSSKFGATCSKIVENLGIDTQPRFNFDSTQSLLRFVQAGHGWAATSALCLFQSPNALKDIAIRKCPTAEFRTFSLLYRLDDTKLANKVSNKFIAVFDKLINGPWASMSKEAAEMVKDHNNYSSLP